jgi:hypothetical protein
MAEVERLLAGRTRDVHLKGELPCFKSVHGRELPRSFAPE